MHMARIERERAEEQHKRDEEALKRRKEHLRRIKRMLEAAFDGDTDEIKKLLKEVRMFLWHAKLYLHRRRKIFFFGAGGGGGD